MFASHPNFCGVFEMFVMFFQTCGVFCLCLCRLTPRTSVWSYWGRVGFITAVVGLGVSGALCGNHDSEFALFAGGTMTFLLIGMTMGGGGTDNVDAASSRVEPAAA